MKKRVLSLLLTLALCVGLVPAAFAAGGFSDVKEGAWFAPYVEKAAEAGLISGVGGGKYDPYGHLTVAQVMVLAYQIHSKAGGGTLPQASGPWYMPYYQYCKEQGLLPAGFSGDSLTRAASRYDMVNILNGAIPAERMEPVKTVTSIPDVNEKAYPAVYAWYRAGIVSGDEQGRFNGTSNITRAEVAVILCQINGLKVPTGGQGQTPEKRDGVTTLQTRLVEDKDYPIRFGNDLYVLENNGAYSLLLIHGAQFGDESGVWLERYHADGSSAGVTEIPMELSYCTGFYEGQDSYYLTFGQNNMEENDSKEVYRIVRYDKSWRRLGAASVTGGQSFTTLPFHHTAHTGLAEENGFLILHTARQRYLTPDDGLRHQSNITIKVRISDMSVVSVSPEFPSNHVSHSFAQYVVFDHGVPVYADHGDAYPRGFALNVEEGGYSRELNFFSFAGKIGNNTTNAFPGGLGVSDSHYLFAGASSPQKGQDGLRYSNAFLAVIPKSGYPDCTPQIKWLTNIPATGTHYVNSVWGVSVNDNTFVVLWQEVDCEPGGSTQGSNVTYSKFCYAVFDGSGNQIGQTATKDGFLSPLCDPTVVGNHLVWARPEQRGPDDPYFSDAEYMVLYDLEITPNSPNSSSQTDRDPADTSTGPSTPADPNPGTGSSQLATPGSFSFNEDSYAVYRPASDAWTGEQGDRCFGFVVNSREDMVRALEQVMDQYPKTIEFFTYSAHDALWNARVGDLLEQYEASHGLQLRVTQLCYDVMLVVPFSMRDSQHIYTSNGPYSELHIELHYGPAGVVRMFREGVLSALPAKEDHGYNPEDADYTLLLRAAEEIEQTYGVIPRSPDYDKAYAVYHYLTHSFTSGNASSAQSVLYPQSINLLLSAKRGNSDSFSMTFQALCHIFDLDCYYLSGTAKGRSHAWNVVRVNGAWYQADPASDIGRSEFQYFLISDAQMYQDHAPGADDLSRYHYPACPRNYAGG